VVSALQRIGTGAYGVPGLARGRVNMNVPQHEVQSFLIQAAKRQATTK